MQGWKGIIEKGTTPLPTTVLLTIDILGGIIPLIWNNITIGVTRISIAVVVTMVDPHHYKPDQIPTQNYREKASPSYGRPYGDDIHYRGRFVF